MKQFQKQKNISLGELINELGEGNFVGSYFDPNWEWEIGNGIGNGNGIKNLIKSILEGYYIGTLLLLKFNKNNFELFNCKNIYGLKKDNPHPKYIVLDGEKRLKALYYAFFQPDVPEEKTLFLYFIDINKLLEENFEEVISYTDIQKNFWIEINKNKEKQFESHLFPLNVMQGGTTKVENWISEYRNYWQNKKEQYRENIKTIDNNKIEKLEKEIQEYDKYIDNAGKLKEVMGELLKEYQISYIELDEDIEVEKILDCIVNSKDIKLNISALFENILENKGILNLDTSVDYPFGLLCLSLYEVLQVMSMRAQNYCSPKYLYYLLPNVEKTIYKNGSRKKIVLNKDRKTFLEQFNKTVDEIEDSIKKLANPREYGMIIGWNHDLPCDSILLVFTAINIFATQEKNIDKIEADVKIKQWYFASIFLQRYPSEIMVGSSSLVESTSAKDYIDMKKWLVDDESEPDFIKNFSKNYFHLSGDKDIRNPIFNILIIKGARDWFTFKLPENEVLYSHDIVPSSWVKENDLRDCEWWDINTIFNKTLLTRTYPIRKVIHNRLPNEYLKEMIKKFGREKIYALMDSHLISKTALDILLRDDFGIDDYYEFLEERQNTIIQCIEDAVKYGFLFLEKSDKVEEVDSWA